MKENSTPESLVSKSTLLMTFVSIQAPVVADIGSSEKKVLEMDLERKQESIKL